MDEDSPFAIFPDEKGPVDSEVLLRVHKDYSSLLPCIVFILGGGAK